MTEQPDSYEDLSQCRLESEQERRLLREQRECTFIWTSEKGDPFGVIMNFLHKDGKFWLTCAEKRARVAAVRKLPRTSICVTSTGTAMKPGKTVSYKGSTAVHASRAVKDWFYPEFSAHLRPDPGAAAVFQRFLDSPHRVILEFTPDYTLSFDSGLMWVRSPGVVGSSGS